MCVIDAPGFSSNGDSILRLLSNAYSHYRLYSKTQNLKFILCFDAVQFAYNG